MDIGIKDFLQGNYFLFFYALGLLISIVRYRAYYDTALKHFPIIIAYTLVSETLGLIIRESNEIRIVYEDQYAHYNVLIFNIFDIIFFLYFFYVFRSVTLNVKFKNWINYGALLFIGCSMANPFFQDVTLFPQMLASSVGSWALVCIALYYLFESRSVKNGSIEKLLFWVSIGLSVFYFLYPLIMLLGYFDYELYLKFHVRALLHLLISVMYCCFIIGFLSIQRIRSEVP